MRLHARMVLVAGVVPLAAAVATSGSVSGRILDDLGRPVPDARVSLENRMSGYRQTVRSDAQGRFQLPNVPFSQYHLEVKAAGLQPWHKDLEVRSTLPIVLTLDLKPQGAEVVVEEKVQLVEDHVASHLDIDRSTLDRLPAAVQSRGMEAALLAVPGMIADENGRFHVKGSHGQTTYVIDGIPVTDQMQATFSNSLDPDQVESMEVITGGIAAEYGGKPVAVVNLTSRSGLGTPNGFEGEVSAGASRFRTAEAGFGLRGGTSTFGYFVTGAASRSDRFLDPVAFENFHNQGSTGRIFSRFDWVLGEADTLRFSLSGGRSRRDVVNLASQEERGQDQRATAGDTNASLAWTHLFSGNRSFDASVFWRHATADLEPTADLGPGSADFPVWARQRRSLDNEGIQAALTQRNGDTSWKVGASRIAYPLEERFAFAITDPGLVTDPADPFYAFTPAGGQVFQFHGRLRPTLTSAYLQGDVHVGGWYVTGGLRWDRFAVGEDVTSELQPRLGVSYRVAATGTVVRVSYDRLLITPENENLALSLSQAAWDLGPKAGTPAPPLRPELQDSVTAGVEQQLGQRGRVILEAWRKRATHAADNEQFLNTGVLFPVAAAQGHYHGVNFRLDLAPVDGWSGYLSFGRTRALFQAPLVGGLQLEALDVPDGTRFLVDHDQQLSIQGGGRYDWERGYVHLSARYDSGLVAGDPAEAAGDPDLAFGIPFVRQDAEGTWRIRPRTIWNIGGGWTWALAPRRAFSASADLLNATDVRGLYNFLSVFGGTHVIPPRTLAVRFKLKF